VANLRFNARGDPRSNLIAIQEINVMGEQFSKQMQLIFDLAAQEARNLHHDFVGTEHLLLALLQEGSGLGGDVLKMLGLDADKVRNEIEKLIARGAQCVSTGELPLTPRAKRVIESARQEAMLVNQKQINGEHLLLGLFREPDGVAAKVLENLGLKLTEVRHEVLKIRIAQMKSVESVVRPVRAGITRKRKMREELLAHLESIYAEEQSRLNNPQAALKAAAERFGNPTELANEFEMGLPLFEKRAYWIERRFGWRPMESAARCMGRQAIFLLALMGIMMSIAAFALQFGAGISGWKGLLPLAALAVLMPLDHFLLGVTFFKLRDAIFGPPHARKSLRRALLLDLLIVLIIFSSGFAFIAAAGEMAVQPMLLFGGVGLVIAIWYHIMAIKQGPAQIADTYWAYVTSEAA
jgi:ATP-dependent Clp protease ATP-binding subunit ClpC